MHRMRGDSATQGHHRDARSRVYSAPHQVQAGYLRIDPGSSEGPHQPVRRRSVERSARARKSPVEFVRSGADDLRGLDLDRQPTSGHLLKDPKATSAEVWIEGFVSAAGRRVDQTEESLLFVV